MIDPENIREMSYDFTRGLMIIELTKPIVMENRSRSTITAKCDYKKFAGYVGKWQSIKHG